LGGQPGQDAREGQRSIESFNKELFEFLDETERDHFWFWSRRRRIRDLVQTLLNSRPRPASFLELGCGSGNVVAMLRSLGLSVVGGDLFAEALAYAQAKSPGSYVQLDARRLPFAAGSFDFVGAFDMIEHLEQPGEVFQEARRVLQQGGYLVVTVPACHHLWSYFDEFSCHRRRYEREELAQAFLEAGFQIVFVHFWFGVLYPLALLRRKSTPHAEAHGAGMAELTAVPVLNEVMKGVLELERELCRVVSLPLGTSLVGVGQTEIQS
jgi:SAM-dependent methyltransferase